MGEEALVERMRRRGGLVNTPTRALTGRPTGFPAPTGPLGITMRMYAPRPPALDRTWDPAPVRAVANP